MPIIPEIIDIPTNEPLELSMCMLGPRSVGKTTVMTSILFDTISILADTDSKLSFDILNEEGKSELQKYSIRLRDAIKNGNAANLPATNFHSRFDFELGTVRKPHKITLSVHDYPGEYLTNEHKAEVCEFVEESTVIIVAIDTPYLMEEGGMYNEEKNKVKVVSDFLKSDDDINALKDKLVLLVPLKCERYAHEGRIEEVADKVEEVYNDVIESFRVNNIACVVTPIQTLGGIELDSMIKDSNSEFGMDARYRPFIRKEGERPRYVPLFCSQPLYYLLSYLTNYYEWLRNQPDGSVLGRWKWLRNIRAFLNNDREFFNEIKKVKEYMIYDESGFRVLTRNSIMQF